MPRKKTIDHEAEPTVLPEHDSDDWVEIYPAAGLAQGTARALLATAEALGHDIQRAVLTVSGGFRVPRDVAESVELPTEAPDDGRHTAPTPLPALDRGAVPDPAPEVTDAPA